MTTPVDPAAVEDSGDRMRRTVTCAEQPPRFESAAPIQLRIDDPGELIAAMPAMVGFVPERSLVVAVLRTAPEHVDIPIIDAVVRFDLDQGARGSCGPAAVFAEQVGRICHGENASEVLAVIVDDRVRAPAQRRSEARRVTRTGSHGALIATLARQLVDDHGVILGGAWAVRAIDKDERWWSLPDAERHGALPDPATSMVTVAHVLDGRPIHRARSELTAMVAADGPLRAQVAAQLEDAVTAARDRYARAVRRGDPDGYHRRMLEHVLWQIANTEFGTRLTARELAELAAALRDRVVRDALFALAVGDHAASAERLWAELVRVLSDSDRADAAALLGYSAYVRGDGPLAGIAFQAALEADPSHPMAILLETALHAGMRPGQLRRLARSGLETAADLGIELC
ncbi:DUF4192 domain-containing protein [Nocardia sp. NPDC057440]|uniref:DUF4192 domain-containing protein n=1 Tax=Nocardia sp. NPDC057440 TaxID=3346134 RepID=UPI00367098BC